MSIVSRSDPAYSLVPITPNDSQDIPDGPVRGVWCGTGGNLAVVAVNDTASVVIKSVPAGTVAPVVAKRVLATGTTAADLLGMR